MSQLPQRLDPDAAIGAVDRVWNTPLFTIAQTPVTPASLVVFGTVLFLTLLLSRMAHRATHRRLGRTADRDAGAIDITARLVSYAVLLVGGGIALQTVGVNLSALFAASAFFAVAIGFAMQNVAQNFVSGVILLVERTIKPGDVLDVDGRVVQVARLGARAAVARTRDEEDIIIPNSALVQNTVINYTLRDKIYRLRTTVGVSYGSDLALVKRVLMDVALAIPDRLPSPEPRVLFQEFADSALTFEVSVWIEDPWRSRVLRSDLNEAIWWGLKKAGITIPFPQRDVHVISTPGGAS